MSAALDTQSPKKPSRYEDPLMHLWEARYRPTGCGPLLKVVDLNGNTAGFRNAYTGMKTTAGRVVRIGTDTIVTMRADGFEQVHSVQRGRMPFAHLG